MKKLYSTLLNFGLSIIFGSVVSVQAISLEDPRRVTRISLLDSIYIENYEPGKKQCFYEIKTGRFRGAWKKSEGTVGARYELKITDPDGIKDIYVDGERHIDRTVIFGSKEINYGEEFYLFGDITRSQHDTRRPHVIVVEDKKGNRKKFEITLDDISRSPITKKVRTEPESLVMFLGELERMCK